MSSTYKTTNLGLNQFVGSDRPKMEDFNFDNQQIDQKFQEHVLSNLHLTEQQREQLGKASYQIGSYSGDGQASRTIAVEGEIGFGLFLWWGRCLIRPSPARATPMSMQAISTPQGCSMASASLRAASPSSRAPPARWMASAACSTRAGKSYLYILFPPAA